MEMKQEVKGGIVSARDYEAGYDYAIATIRRWCDGMYPGNTSRGWLLAIAKDLEVTKPYHLAQSLETQSRQDEG